MPGNRRGIPASQLAREYGVSLSEFTDEVIEILARFDANASGNGQARRREICAAVSAAMIAALEASALSEDERGRLQPLIHEVLGPFWSKHCAADGDTVKFITARSTHYLTGRNAGSQVKTAVNIVGALLEALEVPEQDRPALTKRLSPAFAHRMVGDVFRINDLRQRHGIELSLLATLVRVARHDDATTTRSCGSCASSDPSALSGLLFEQLVELDRHHLDRARDAQQEVSVEHGAIEALVGESFQFTRAGAQHPELEAIRGAAHALRAEAQVPPRGVITRDQQRDVAPHLLDFVERAPQEQRGEFLRRASASCAGSCMSFMLLGYGRATRFLRSHVWQS